MDTLLTVWEMNLESEQTSGVREEIATGPSEPYTLDWNTINWNWSDFQKHISAKRMAHAGKCQAALQIFFREHFIVG